MPGNESFNSLRYSVSRTLSSIDGFIARLNELELSEFPTGSPKSLIELLRNVLLESRNSVANIADTRLLAWHSNLVLMLSEILLFLDNTKTEQTPRGLVKLVENLVDKNVKIVASPQAQFNYSVINITDVLKQSCENGFTSSVVSRLFDSAPDIRIVCFPRIERDNVLLHTILGHEIGHNIASLYLNEEDLSHELNTIHQELQRVFSANTQVKIEDFSKYLEMVRVIRKRGVEELISDIVCVALMGPSGLFGMYDLLTSTGGLDSLPSPNQFYPPSRYRLRLMVEYLRSINALDFESLAIPQEIKQPALGFLNHIEQIISTNSDRGVIKSDPIVGIAYSSIENKIKKMIEYVQQKLDTRLYNSELIQSNMPDSIERLLLKLPANKLGVYPNERLSNWQSTILSGWLLRIAIVENEGNVLFTGIDEALISKLTLASIEYIDITNQYIAHTEK